MLLRAHGDPKQQKNICILRVDFQLLVAGDGCINWHTLAQWSGRKGQLSGFLRVWKAVTVEHRRESLLFLPLSFLRPAARRPDYWFRFDRSKNHSLQTDRQTGLNYIPFPVYNSWLFTRHQILAWSNQRVLFERDMRNACELLPESLTETPLGRPRCRWEDNIKRHWVQRMLVGCISLCIGTRLLWIR
jgi:hypothetical protein